MCNSGLPWLILLKPRTRHNRPYGHGPGRGARYVIPDTNAIESLNARFRKAVRHRGHFPTEQTVLKVLYLVATEHRPNRSNPADRINSWKPILNALTIHYGDRIQAAS